MLSHSEHFQYLQLQISLEISDRIRPKDMGLQAAEHLVTELAAGRVGTDLETTERQKELSIPPFLVYLFGIMVAEDEYKQCKGQNPALNYHESNSLGGLVSRTGVKRFYELQKRYLTVANTASTRSVEQRKNPSYSEPKLYKLTTRIFPSKDQQAIVKRDFFNECEKLESLSNEALEALLMEDPSSSRNSAKNKRTTKKSRKQNKKQQLASKTKEKDILVPNGEEEKKASNCERLAATASLEHPCVDGSMDENQLAEAQSKSDDEEQEKSSLGSCVPDGINAPTPNRSSGQMILKSEFGNSTKKDEGLIRKQQIGDDSNEEEDSSLVDETSSVENNESLVNNLLSPLSMPRSAVPTLETTRDHVSLHHSTIDADVLTNRIADIEHDLAETNRQLIEERLEHTKAMRKERERYENLMQSLQLRLYISENKVRTYEDALEKHMQAVSTINGNRSAKTKNDDERIQHSSPLLISKVLKNVTESRGI